MITAGKRVASALTGTLILSVMVASCSKDSTGPAATRVGGWEGTTSQGKVLRFYVEQQGVPLIAVGFEVVGTSCTEGVVAFLSREAPDAPFAVTGDALTVATSGSSGTITLNGTFTSATAASGTLVVTSTRCGGSINATWTATKASGPAADLTGTWTGSYSTSLISNSSIVLTITQTGPTLSGTYVSPNGGMGSISGVVSGKVGTFRLNQTTAGCIGHFDGHAALNEGPEFLFFSYAGSDCLGTHAHAGGTVSR
jgi:hypothetical protein